MIILLRSHGGNLARFFIHSALYIYIFLLFLSLRFARHSGISVPGTISFEHLLLPLLSSPSPFVITHYFVPI